MPETPAIYSDAPKWVQPGPIRTMLLFSLTLLVIVGAIWTVRILSGDYAWPRLDGSYYCPPDPERNVSCGPL